MFNSSLTVTFHRMLKPPYFLLRPSYHLKNHPSGHPNNFVSNSLKKTFLNMLMNCLHSSINSVTFYKTFISISTCMCMVIMGHINIFKLLRDILLEYWIQYFPSNSGKLAPSFGCLILYSIIFEPYLFQTCEIVDFLRIYICGGQDSFSTEILEYLHKNRVFSFKEGRSLACCQCSPDSKVSIYAYIYILDFS